MLEYVKTLNEAQYAAVSSESPSLLVVAGAGSGKTRTIVYRLAWLVEHGVEPNKLLLLTFTRKAAREMLNRAHELLDHELVGIQGGTFHSFAFKMLQYFHPDWLGNRPFTMMDQADIIDAIKFCKDKLHIGVNDRSFPKIQTIAAILSKARNKELTIETILKKDSYQLLPHASAIYDIGQEYQKFRREKGLLDYDDLLFELDLQIQKNTLCREYLFHHFQYVLIDEYQDTNLVQARIVKGLAFTEQNQQCCHVMAVGDEAQSIYAFRGATIRNILDFPKLFPNAEIIRLEENYRSTQPILTAANIVLKHADESFHKKLFTRQKKGKKVQIFHPANEEEQAKSVVRQIKKLLNNYPPEEITVLFRAGFHSYHVELLLGREGIRFKKYGGLKYIEAAHIKDCLSFARLHINPLDLPAFTRLCSMHKGVGVKTIEKLYTLIHDGNEQEFEKAIKNKSLACDLGFIKSLRSENYNPTQLIASIVQYFEPRLKERYPDDWPQRQQGLEEIILMAQNYDDIGDFIADLVLNTAQDEEKNLNGYILLSTIHSAKGLEWDCVLIIDLIEGRFPSHHALKSKEDFEEERRLMYVAVTRARKELCLFASKTVFNRQEGFNVAISASPFLEELEAELAEDNDSESELAEDEEMPVSKPKKTAKKKNPAKDPKSIEPGTACYHPIFGQGKIIALLNSKTVKANFLNYGDKIIMLDYLKIEAEN